MYGSCYKSGAKSHLPPLFKSQALSHLPHTSRPQIKSCSFPCSQCFLTLCSACMPLKPRILCSCRPLFCYAIMEPASSHRQDSKHCLPRHQKATLSSHYSRTAEFDPVSLEISAWHASEPAEGLRQHQDVQSWLGGLSYDPTLVRQDPIKEISTGQALWPAGGK
jgi:hypothetical protein